jgi:hypothetical protein
LASHLYFSPSPFHSSHLFCYDYAGKILDSAVMTMWAEK